MSSQHTSPPPFRWHYAEFEDSNFHIRGRTLYFILIIFAVLMGIALLFIYSRWVCRWTPPQPQPPPEPSPSQPQQPPPRPRRGLNTATINNMPIVLYGNSGDSAAGNPSETECCICLGIFGDKEDVKVLPECNHCFHSGCLDKWLTAQSSCPICRAPLQNDSPV